MSEARPEVPSLNPYGVDVAQPAPTPADAPHTMDTWGATFDGLTAFSEAPTLASLYEDT